MIPVIWQRERQRAHGRMPTAKFSPGWHVTRGLDDWSLAELTLVGHADPVYTNSYWCHSSAASRSLWNCSAVFVRSS